MRFTVLWLPSAESNLAEIWMASVDRRDIDIASEQIDEALRQDPWKATTFVDDLYFLRRDPLVALCEINLEDCTVRVIEVRRRESA